MKVFWLGYKILKKLKSSKKSKKVSWCPVYDTSNRIYWGHLKEKVVDDMKGYSVTEGYMGYVEGRYMLFASEADYRDYLED